MEERIQLAQGECRRQRDIYWELRKRNEIQRLRILLMKHDLDAIELLWSRSGGGWGVEPNDTLFCKITYSHTDISTMTAVEKASLGELNSDLVHQLIKQYHGTPVSKKMRRIQLRSQQRRQLLVRNLIYRRVHRTHLITLD